MGMWRPGAPRATRQRWPSPSTQAVFRVEMIHDFAEGGDSLRVYRATVQATGRGGTVVDSRAVFVVVPARGHGLPVTP